jgi:hypothetical protein
MTAHCAFIDFLERKCRKSLNSKPREIQNLNKNDCDKLTENTVLSVLFIGFHVRMVCNDQVK